MPTGVGDRFQQETKYQPRRLSGGMLSAARPPGTKEYPEHERVELPRPESPETSLHDVLRGRQSVRDFAVDPLSLAQVSWLLWAAGGVRARRHGVVFRTAPSAGALYPIETYLVAHRVDDLSAGVYHYHVAGHALEELRRGDCRGAMAAAALGQAFCADAAAVIAWTAIFARSKWKYGQRAYRYVYLDAGHIAENLALAAVALGLGSCQVGALFDNEVNALLGVNGTEESVLYLSAVGVPAPE
jgi:SagB-type dehydrogenase family enzyme